MLMSRSAPTPTLLDTITVLLPVRNETLFVKACLGIDTDRSWRGWRASEPELKEAIANGAPACKRLLALLFNTLMREGIEVPPADLGILRLAATWEERRARRVASLLADVLRVLRENAIEPVASKGIALAHLAYPKPSLRHCHDIDLIVPASELETAAEAISRIGFTAKRTERSSCTEIVLVHEDGLPVVIHAGLPLGVTTCPPTPLKTIRADIAGNSVLILDPTELLMFLATQLIAGRMRDRISWVVDAVLLLRQVGTDKVDWASLTESARNHGLSLVLLAMLSYLNAEFAVAIPDAVIDRLGRQAREDPLEVRDRLLFVLRRNPEASSSKMFQYSGWRSRLDIIRWTVVPTNAYMRSWCREKGLHWSLAWYVLRPFRRLSIHVLSVCGMARAATDSKDLS